MIIAAPKTGVIRANILIVKNREMERKGIKDFLFFKPGIDKVLLVIRRLVYEMVVEIPARITPRTAISWAPKPAYLVWEENGVIKVHPVVTLAALLQITFDMFFLLEPQFLEPREPYTKDFEKILEASFVKGVNLFLKAIIKELIRLSGASSIGVLGNSVSFLITSSALVNSI